jgi:phage gp36-like protein
MSYATVTDLRAYYDLRLVAELVSDQGVETSVAALATDPALLELFRGASGRVEAACQVGQKYTRADLTTLAADASNGSVLRATVCHLVMASLMGRRVAGEEQLKAALPGYADALFVLKELQNGTLVFNIDATLEATVPETTEPAVNDMNRPTNWNPMFGSWGWRNY